MEMTKKTKVFVSVTLVCALSLTMFTGCTFGFRTPDYIAFGWSPIAQEGAIWRSTDGVIVIDSRNYAINGYIVINGEKVTIDSVEFSGKSNIMVFSHVALRAKTSSSRQLMKCVAKSSIFSKRAINLFL